MYKEDDIANYHLLREFIPVSVFHLGAWFATV